MLPNWKQTSKLDLALGVTILLAGCGDEPPMPCTYPGDSVDTSSDSASFPTGFLWGTATAPHQVDTGPTFSDAAATDWSTWEAMEERIENGDRSISGPDHWTHFASDFDQMAADGMNSYRFGIEWARIFPTRNSFDSMTPDATAVAHYHSVLDALRSRTIEPMVTLHHFSTPTWLLDPAADAESIPTMGFLSSTMIADFEKWARFVATEFGEKVDLWITINEPLVLILGGYLSGDFPPGLLLSDDATVLALAQSMIFSHAAAYDAIHEADETDADGDGSAALVSIANHNRIFWGQRPCDEIDDAAAERLRYLNNEYFFNAIVFGDLDVNGDADLDDSMDQRQHPDLVGRADFLGINYYTVSLVDGHIPLSSLIPGLPSLSDIHTDLPKTDVGWAIYPAGFGEELERAFRRYSLPIYVTENGVADQGGALRARFLVEHLHELATTIAEGVDVRGYFHWSFLDNFEWSEGFCPRFGLYRIDYTMDSRPRSATAGVLTYRAIIEANRVTRELADSTDDYGDPVTCD